MERLTKIRARDRLDRTMPREFGARPPIGLLRIPIRSNSTRFLGGFQGIVWFNLGVFRRSVGWLLDFLVGFRPVPPLLVGFHLGLDGVSICQPEP